MALESTTKKKSPKAVKDEYMAKFDIYVSMAYFVILYGIFRPLYSPNKNAEA